MGFNVIFVLIGVIVCVLLWILVLTLSFRVKHFLIRLVPSGLLMWCPFMTVQFWTLSSSNIYLIHLKLFPSINSLTFLICHLLLVWEEPIWTAIVCCLRLLLMRCLTNIYIHNYMDIFAVTETWLDYSIDDHEIFPYSSSSISILQNYWNCYVGEVAFFFHQELNLLWDLTCVKVT